MSPKMETIYTVFFSWYILVYTYIYLKGHNLGKVLSKLLGPHTFTQNYLVSKDLHLTTVVLYLCITIKAVKGKIANMYGIFS